MVTLFVSKMAGGSDDDDVILASFECFENEGKIDAESFRHSLMTFGVKFSASEVDDAFAEMKIDEGMIDAAHLKGLMVAKSTAKLRLVKYRIAQLQFHEQLTSTTAGLPFILRKIIIAFIHQRFDIGDNAQILNLTTKEIWNQQSDKFNTKQNPLPT